MPEPAASVLVTPISPQQEGNGLAHRARFWQRALGALGPVRTILVPVSGVPHPGDESVTLPTVASDDPRLPARSRWAPEDLGRAWRAGEAGPVELVLALRADVAGFALGAAAVDDAFVAVDLDDDDAEVADAFGQADEAARYRGWQTMLSARADVVLSATGFGSTRAVPNSVSVGPDPGPRPTPSDPVIVMVGNFTYEPNVRGAGWFVDEVLPRVLAEVPGARVVLAGAGSERFAPHGAGFVPALDDLHRDAAVAVIPLLQGSGSRIKALDAFVARVPVVGTTVGMSGLPVVPDAHCLIADEPDAFAEAVVRVLRDPERGAELADAARSFVAAFDETTVAADAIAVLRAALAQRGPTVFTPAADLVVTEEPDGLVVVDETSMTAHHLNELAAAVFLLAESPQTGDALAAAFAATVERPVDDVRALVAAAVSALVGGGLLLPHHGGQPH